MRCQTQIQGKMTATLGLAVNEQLILRINQKIIKKNIDVINFMIKYNFYRRDQIFQILLYL